MLQVRDLQNVLQRTEAEARDAARTADARQVDLETSASTAEARVGEVKRRLVAAEGEAQRKAALVQVWRHSLATASIVSCNLLPHSHNLLSCTFRM